MRLRYRTRAPRVETDVLRLKCLCPEGFLEAWLELQKKTGLEELKRTTAHEPDYDKLMRYRIDVPFARTG